MSHYTNDQLRDVFQRPFDKDTWKTLLIDIFRANNVRVEPEKFTGPEQPETGWYMGNIDTPDNYRIGLFIYRINNGSVAHKRVGLRNLVRSWVNPNWGEFDAAIVVFNDGTDWRLSFVCDIKDVATAPKRFTYVFGEKDNFYRTPIERFTTLQDEGPSFKNIHKAFSVEALSDDFFDQYLEYYADFVEFITGKRYVKESNKWVEKIIHAPNYQYRSSFDGDDKLVRDYIKKMFGRIVFLYFLQRKGWLDGDRQYMHHLFYNSDKKDDFLDGVLEPLFFEVLNTDKPYRTAAAKSLPGSDNIPYLNGGLFAADEIDDLECVFPEDLFKRLFDFLDSYNFTIDENDTNDAEIGIDPEMLGRIFENLLEDNKDKGTYYTPKEIVGYMCRESIIAYLNSTLPDIDRKVIRNLVENLDASYLNATEKIEIRRSLMNIQICDPAIGSGAFPMGLVNILSKLYLAIKPDTDTSKMKRHIMEQNVYGVDFEKGAVDIARLRFWLAMIVEEKEPIPLPNLHFKIMQGNSLLEYYKGIDLSDLTEVKDDSSLFDLDNEERQQLSLALKQYYNTSDHNKRDIIFNDIINNVRRQLFYKGITLPAGMDPSANAEFFLWHTWFEDVFAKGGFDIVIGNPPYISAPTQVANPILNEQRNNIIASKQYKSLYQKWDLYIAFVELGLSMLKPNGIESMIIPYPFSNQGYAMKCRQTILDKFNLLEVSDLKEVKIFKNATVQNCILFVENKISTDRVRISHAFEDADKKQLKLLVDYEKEKEHLVQNSKGIWDFTQKEQKGKLHPDLHVLGDLCYISKGMVLNADEKTDKGGFKKEDLISDVQDSIHSRKYIEAKDIKPYAVTRVRYLEWDTDRCPDLLSRPTFRELYDVPKLLINCLGDFFATVSEKENYLHNHSLYCAVPWTELSEVSNKSINGSIRKYATMPRVEMEELSKNISLKYLCAILNSKYGSVLLQEQRGGDYHIYPDHIRNIPIPVVSKEQQAIIDCLVDRVMATPDKSSPEATDILNRIDTLVYKAYNLSYTDILATNPSFTLTQQEYDGLIF